MPATMDNKDVEGVSGEIFVPENIERDLYNVQAVFFLQHSTKSNLNIRYWSNTDWMELRFCLCHNRGIM